MPDWSYRTLFQPLLRMMPPRAARTIVLRSMGAVSRMPGGALLIKTLGHMEPSPLLTRRVGQITLETPVGLSGEVDPDWLAQRALAQLGFGFAWIGPVTAEAEPKQSVPRILMDHGRETIAYPDGPETIGLGEAVRRIREAGHRLPIFARIAPTSGATPEQAARQLRRMMRELGAAGAAGFAVDTGPVNAIGASAEYAALIERIAAEHRQLHPRPNDKLLFWHLPADCPHEAAAELASALARSAWSGIVIGPGTDNGMSRPRRLAVGPDQLERALSLIHSVRDHTGPNFLIQTAAGIHEPIDALRAMQAGADQVLLNSGFVYAGPGTDNDMSRPRRLAVGPDQLERALSLIHSVRDHTGPNFLIQTAAGIHEPIDALRAMQAGADQVLLNSGFVYAGPGLPKRINEAVLYEKVKRLPAEDEPSFWRHWGWMCLLGIGMMIGGFIAWMIAVTSVLLPYDEAFLGMTWQQLRQLHPHLLHFMSHDRITLAGTMISIGILYYMLAKHGMRHGRHWARIAVLTSCLIGFPSFFLYLGYGYFDPLHAGAAIILLPMFLLSMRRNPDRPSREPVNLRNDRLWRRAAWGQLCFVALGIALAVGGLTIAGVGVTRVFVPSDLVYLNLTPEQIDAFNPRLIPLIAHDRAGFGGALLADAAALLATALWGIQQGARWLWATLLLGGAPAFYAAISVHFAIGYVDTIHLLPAYFALFLYIVGLVLLYPYMMNKPEPYSSEAAAASA